jgi:hypothetical protein
MKYPFLATVWAFVIGVGCGGAPPEQTYEYVRDEASSSSTSVAVTDLCHIAGAESGIPCALQLEMQRAPADDVWEVAGGDRCHPVFPSNTAHDAILTFPTDWRTNTSWVRYMACPRGARSTCTETGNDIDDRLAATWRVECRR